MIDHEANRLKLDISSETNQPKIRVDKFITDYLNQTHQSISRSQVQEWIKKGSIRINNQPVNNKTKILPNQNISIDVSLSINQNHQTWSAHQIKTKFEIIFEDDDLLIINKPAGLVVHPGAGHYQDTLINGLLLQYRELENISRNGVIHRLDKDTSGVLCIAKNQSAHHLLTEQINARQMEKIYLALVNGNVISGGEINTPISRSKHNRLKQVVHEKGKKAITQYTVLKRFQMHSLLRVNLLTGRTHQIRVHLKHIGFPIIGDRLYHLRKGNFIAKGSSEELIKALQLFKRQALHAHKLTLTHPKNKKRITFRAEIPSDIKQLLGLLDEK